MATTAKTTTKKSIRKPASSRRPTRAQTVRGRVAISGNVYARRDVVIGDQTNVIDNRVAHVNTAPELVAALQAVRIELAALQHAPELDAGDRQTVTIIEGRVKEAEVEAAKPEPDGGSVITTLQKATSGLLALSGGVSAAVTLGEAVGKVAPHLQHVLEMARRLFGG